MAEKALPRGIAPKREDILMDRIFVVAAHALLEIYEILTPALREEVAKIEARLLCYDQSDTFVSIPKPE